MSRMRLAFLVDKSSPLYIGGYEDRVWNLARGAAADHQVRIYTSLDERTRSQDGVEFIRTAPRTFQPGLSGDRSISHSALFALSQLRNQLVKWDPDCIYVESIPYFHLPIVGRWIRKVRARVLLNVNEAWDAYASYRMLPGAVVRSVLRACLQEGIEYSDVALAVSQVTAQSLRRSYSAPSVEVLETGVDLEMLGKIRESSRATTYDYIMVGRLVSIKRVSDFLRALSLLRSRALWNGRAAIVGDGPLRQQLMELVVSFGLKSNVDILGFLSAPEKFEILSASRTFVLCSEREGLSLSTIEAFALGKPAVVAQPLSQDVFGVSAIARDGINSLYYPVGDIEQLANRLLRLATDEQLHRQMAESATGSVDSFDWHEVTERFLQIVR